MIPLSRQKPCHFYVLSHTKTLQNPIPFATATTAHIHVYVASHSPHPPPPPTHTHTHTHYTHTAPFHGPMPRQSSQQGSALFFKLLTKQAEGDDFCFIRVNKSLSHAQDAVAGVPNNFNLRDNLEYLHVLTLSQKTYSSQFHPRPNPGRTVF